MSRRTGHGGRPRHPEHRGGPRPHDPTRLIRPTSAAAAAGEGPFAEGARPAVDETRAETVVGHARAEFETPLYETAATLGSWPRGSAEESESPSATGAPDGSIDRDGPPNLVPPMGAVPAPGVAHPRPAPYGGASEGDPAAVSAERHVGCTAPQLRRFIKSRAYVPMHEIRRRFLITSEDDDVTRIDLVAGRIYVGLPEREGQMLGELLRGGEIGYELQLDPVTPVVVGVYPMRPVTRG